MRVFNSRPALASDGTRRSAGQLSDVGAAVVVHPQRTPRARAGHRQADDVGRPRILTLTVSLITLKTPSCRTNCIAQYQSLSSM